MVDTSGLVGKVIFLYFLKIHFWVLIIILNGSVSGSAGVFDFEIIRGCSNKGRYLEYQHT